MHIVCLDVETYEDNLYYNYVKIYFHKFSENSNYFLNNKYLFLKYEEIIFTSYLLRPTI